MSLNHRYYTTLPRWGRRLNRRFVAAFGKPAGLWLPNDVVNKAYDFSSNRNIGTLSGGITTTPGGFGVLGSAWKGDGSTGFIKITGYKGITGTAARSVAVVFNTVETSAASNALISWGANTPTSPGDIFAISVENGVIWCRCDGGVTGNWGSGYNDGKWHLVVITFPSAGTMADVSCYVDGLPLSGTYASGTTALNTAAVNDVKLGALVNIAPPSWIYAGYMSAVLIFGTALTAAQVSPLYDCLLTGEPFPLFGPEIIKRRYSTRQLVGSVFKFRRTLSQFGTRIGSRQVVG